ncbi:sugar efflux transporter for intercellular exchange-domain-containing protein [Chytridium lagenaria]|nr:sugar efflux transporter for intercellular exchange-domain-containing protein [Chytridium lagenaria]
MSVDCSSSTCQIVMKYVVPSLGSVTALCLMLAPVPAVLAAAKAGVVGNLNPLPISLITVNCLGWVAYSWLVKDYFIAIPNLLGWSIGTFNLLTIYPLTPPGRDRNLIMIILIGISSMVYLLSTISFCSLPEASARLVLGVMTNVVLIGFYGSPLTAFLEVVRRRDASALNVPLAVMSFVNSALWVVYGLVQGDWFITVPNGLGVIFATTQLVLLYMYPRTIATVTRRVDRVARECESKVEGG